MGHPMRLSPRGLIRLCPRLWGIAGGGSNGSIPRVVVAVCYWIAVSAWAYRWFIGGAS
jgi:hypothetical protein